MNSKKSLEKLSNENYNYTYHFGEALKNSINSKTKLEELGYEINDFIEDDDLDSDCDFVAEKSMGRGIYIVIGVFNNKVHTNYVYDQFQLHKNRERLEVLKLAIETMENDLKVVRYNEKDY